MPAALHERSWLRLVCRLGAGAEACRYITVEAEGFRCAKAADDAALKAFIDRRVAAGLFIARGDNCLGLDGDILEKELPNNEQPRS